MPKQRGTIHIQPPLAGVKARASYQSQPPFSAYESVNMWPVDARSGRFVPASRPSLSTATVPGGSVVNMLTRINGYASGKPYQSMLGNFGGNLYWWNGVGWTAATGAQAGDVPTSRAVYATPFLEKVYIATNTNAPIEFDYVTGAAATVVASEGTVPVDARAVETWQGALWLAGQLETPHILYGSRVGDATDWDFSVSIDDEGGAFATTGDDEGLLSGPITALMPQTNDVMIVSTLEGLFALRGHPRVNGIFDPISKTTYVLGQGAWCKAPGDILFFLTPLGLMTLPPNDGAVPIQISRDSMPSRLIGLLYTYENPVVAMAYDSRWNGIHITVRGTEEQAWWFDLNQGGFSEMRMNGYPYVLQEFPPFTSDTTSGVLYAGAGYGGLARFDAFGTEIFRSSITTGPVKLTASPMHAARITKFRLILGRDTPIDGVTGRLLIAAGSDGQDAVSRLENGDAQYSIDLVTLRRNNGVCTPHISGHAFVFTVETDDGNVAFEEASAEVITAGMNTATRATQIVAAGEPTVPGDFDTEFDDTLWEGYVGCTPSTPGSTLTDYTHFFDLSLHPAAWWAAIATDGSDLRITDDNNLEVPYDLIEFDHSSQTGLVAFKYTQTIPARPVRMWAGSVVQSPYEATDTYGQYNAYDDNWRGFWPDGGGADRTQYLNVLTMTGATAGDSTGLIGASATNYNNATNWYGSSSVSIPSTTPVTLITLAQREGSNNFTEDSYGLWQNLSNSLTMIPRTNSTLASTRAIAVASTSRTVTSDDGTAADGVWHHHTAVFASATSRTAYIDGGGDNTDTGTKDVTGITHVVVGKAGPQGLSAQSFDGLFSLTQLHDAVRNSDWIAYQSAMMDQASFWTCDDWLEVNDPEDITMEPPPSEDACPLGGLTPTETGTWTGYAHATPQSTATAYLFQQHHYIDLSLMPTEWWSAVQSDGSDIRATDAGNIFLGLDLIEFDATAETGFAVVRTNVATSGSPQIRLWVGNGSAITVPPCATYGQYFAYNPYCIGFWPDGGGDDRTQYQRHLTPASNSGSVSAPTPGDSTGPVGNTATDYDGTAQYAFYNEANNGNIWENSTSITNQVTLCAAVILDGDYSIDYGLVSGATNSYLPQTSLSFTFGASTLKHGETALVHTNGKLETEFVVGTGAGQIKAISDTVSPLSQWRAYHGGAASTWSTTANPTKRIYVDGANEGGPAIGAGSHSFATRLSVGATAEGATPFNFLDGRLSLVMAFASTRYEPYAAYEADMLDQSTFWDGSWTWVGGSSSLPQS